MISYDAVHQRLRTRRGPASIHHCCLCGFPANAWAYDHKDTAEVKDDRGRVYSLSLGRYMPLCTRCHYRFDAPYSGDPRRVQSATQFPRPNPHTVEVAKSRGWWPPPPPPPFIE